MTPEQIDAVTNGLISLEHFVDTYGLSLGVIVGAGSALWGAGRIWQRIEDRRHINRGIKRLSQYANHAGSRPILDDFHQPRKEDRS